MTNYEAAEVQTIGAGGFRVLRAPTEIEVIRDKETFDSSTRRTRLAILLSAVVLSCLMLIGQFIRIDFSRPAPVAWAPHAFPFVSPASFLPLLIALGVLYAGTVNLSCTQEKVQTTWMRFGKVKRVLSFSKADVTQFQYSGASNPLIGRAGYLSFLVKGETVKCLPGLKPDEAQLILNLLREIGYHVVDDPQAGSPSLKSQ